ncbi:MAG: divalent metal cation transporter, partial [Steroidobacteraceae bacterium]
IYGGLIVIAAALVLAPGTPLGLLTNAVQTLAGVLLPSATVFLLLLCNDRAVLGPYVNGPVLNVLTGAIIAGLVALSLILTASVVDPDLGAGAIAAVLAGGALAGVVIAGLYLARADRTRRHRDETSPPPVSRQSRSKPSSCIHRAAAKSAPEWRMPPLGALEPPRVTPLTRVWMMVLRGYLIVAAGLVLWRIVRLVL